MKKIININLSGRVIPIEDSAYEKLQAYIESLRRYFAHEDGRDEIINDIESRIAELMSEKVRKGASCVTEADVEEIASAMGRPEDFDADTAETASNASTQQTQQDYTYSQPKQKRRLYRDSSDKFIGGVCSGIANYLNTDPTIVRILFAIITFGGFGLGFLIYILLWMFLPDRAMEGYTGKRLFRNPDDRVIGGVAGGLSAYFNMRASTLRLIFAAPILLSIFFSILRNFTWHGDFDFFPNIVFGSLSGTFIVAYIVLWIVLPEAASPYEKMEMRGEKVDVNTIRQNVKDGMENVKDRVKNWSDEVKESAQNLSSKAKTFADTRGRTFAREVNESARSGGRGLGHAIAVLFKVFFLFIAGTIAFALFIALIALIFGGVAWWPINNFLWTSKWQQLYAWGTVIFFFAIPLVAFIVWVVRRIMRVRSRRSYLGWTFGFLWTIGWVCATLFAISVARDLSEDEYRASTININQPPTGKMVVTVSEPELSYTGRFDWANDDGDGWDLSDDTMKLSNVDFDFLKSDDSAYHVTVKRYSHGRTKEEALMRADKIEYKVISMDSVLDLGSGYAIDRNSKFRLQHVIIEIRVPVGKKIRFSRSVNDKLNPDNFDFNNGRGDRGLSVRRRGYDSHFYYSRYLRPETDYIMDIDGRLNDPNEKPVPKDGYRYDGRDSRKSDSTQNEKGENAEESGFNNQEIISKDGIAMTSNRIPSISPLRSNLLN